ncbi:plexin A3-like isoform X2 [Dysidea avara]
MTISENGEVFAAGHHSIHKLSANLSHLINVTITSVIIDGFTVTYYNDTRATGLSPTNGGRYIVACVNAGVCNAYNVDDLNYAMTNMGRVTGGTNAVVAMFPGETEDSAYVGTVSIKKMVQRNQMTLAQCTVTDKYLVADRTRSYSVVPSLLKSRIFHTGFIVNDFVYYVVEDGTKIRIIRVCNKTAGVEDLSSTKTKLFRALYEVELVCGGPALYAAASVTKLVNSYSSTLVLAVRQPLSNSTSRVCTYSISDINTAMDNSLTACAAGEDRRVVWDSKMLPQNFTRLCSESFSICNLYLPFPLEVEALSGGSLISTPVVSEPLTQFTSSVIVQVEGELLIFIGTSDGRLIKYFFKHNNFNNSLLYDATNITNTSIISLQWSLGSDYVYGLTSEQVILIPIEDCSQSLRDCTSCAASMDPLCGWCSIEKKCSRRSECSNNTETRRWIQEKEMCMGNFSISPNALSAENINQKFNITADLIPPPLTDESYYCVFGDLGSSIVEGNLIPGMDFTNLTCDFSIVFIKSHSSSEQTASSTLEFSLKSNLTDINFVSLPDGLPYYNCSSYVSCRSCLSSDNLCGWCLYDKKCTSSSDQCRVVTDWINTNNDTSESCPLTLDTTNGYQQPVGVSRNLSTEAENLPPPNSNYTYQCVIQFNGSQSILQAEYTGPDGLVCIVRDNDIVLPPKVNQTTGTISVTWTGPGVEYIIEEVVSLRVLLYDCPSLAGGCSSCLSVSNTLMLDCGWCNSLTSCVVMESCSDGSTFTTTSSTCPLPQITMVWPTSCPYQGGTDVTISGTDLGVVVDDIINITIGGAPCMIHRDSYQPGVGVKCQTTESKPGNTSTDLVIPIYRDGSVEVATLPGGFRYAEVQVLEFYPKRAPMSGNVLVTITGMNFDVSNPALIDILLTSTHCDLISNQSARSTSVQCIAGSRRTTCAGPVVFTIDNAVVRSHSNFTYTDDPQVYALVNHNIIRSGGINITFIGTLLDVIEDPTMTVNITNDTSGRIISNYTTECYIVSSDRLKCLFPSIQSIPLNSSYSVSYSLVLAHVPGLSKLEQRSGLAVTIVDDPVFDLIETVPFSPDEDLVVTGRNVPCIALLCDGVVVTVGGIECPLRTVNITSLSCDPPLLSGMKNITVSVGENLKFILGRMQYQSGSSSSVFMNLSLIIAMFIAIVIIIVLLLIFASGIIWYMKHCNKRAMSNKIPVSVANVSMYTSPAYGTHQVFSEPGLDHLYESIDDYVVQSPQQSPQENVVELLNTAEVIANTIAEATSQHSTCTTTGCDQAKDYNEHVSSDCDDGESLTGYVNDVCSDSKEYLELLDGEEEVSKQSCDEDSTKSNEVTETVVDSQIAD